MNYGEIKKTDIANGIGVRVTLFVSGCTRHCKNCFNAETWDFNYGKPFTRNGRRGARSPCSRFHQRFNFARRRAHGAAESTRFGAVSAPCSQAIPRKGHLVLFRFHPGDRYAERRRPQPLRGHGRIPVPCSTCSSTAHSLMNSKTFPCAFAARRTSASSI